MKYFCWLIGLLGGLHIQAQGLYSESLDYSAGLPASDIYDIQQDQEGFIWLTTENGLLRYDGFSSQSFKDTIQTSTAGSHIQVDKLGRVWYENFDGFVYYVENEKIKTIPNQKPISFIPYGLNEHYLYLVQKDGIYIYDITNLALIKKLPLALKWSYGFTCTTRDKFYYIADYELNEISLDFSIRKRTLTEDFGQSTIFLYSFNNEVFLVPKFNERKKLYKLIQENFTYKAHQKLTDIQFIHQVLKNENQIWVATPNGLHLFHDNEVHNYFKGLSISCIFQDKQGNLWVGSIGNGVFFISDFNSKWLEMNEFQPQVLQKLNNGLVIGTNHSKLLFYDNQFKLTNTIRTDNKNSQIYYIHTSKFSDKLYFSSSGFHCLENGKIRHWDIAVKQLVEIDEKYIAVAASGFMGLICVDESKKSDWDSLFQRHQENGMLQLLKNVRAKSIVYEPQQKKFTVATNNGVFEVYSNKVQELKYQDASVLAKTIIFLDEKLYILENQGSLLIYDHGKWEKGPIFQDGIIKLKLFQNSIYLIAEGKIFQYNQNKIKFIEKLRKSFDIKDFSISSNEMMILNSKGVFKKSNFQSTIKSKAYNNPRFIIHPLKINNQIYPFTHVLNLPPDSNQIEIRFSVIDFNHTIVNHIRYKMNTNTWQSVQENQRNLQLISLEPGTYEITFELNGVIQEQKIKFSIQKRIWQQTWFRLCVVACIVWVVYSYYHNKLERIQKQNQLNHEKDRLEIEKQALEKNLSRSILTAIKSQMNPHFFYNALNTIQAFIFTNDKSKASSYLSKFSKLTRLILENSEKEYITLAEELVSLKLYLELENMRFSDAIAINIQNNCTSSSIDINFPPALIQPYIENAIKHGLMHKKGEKKLSITFDEIGDFLHVKIYDNGIGRKKSMEINTIMYEKSKSFSSDANAKRLEIINQGKDKKMGIKITDLISENEIPIGTLVELIIPIQYT